MTSAGEVDGDSDDAARHPYPDAGLAEERRHDVVVVLAPTPVLVLVEDFDVDHPAPARRGWRGDVLGPRAAAITAPVAQPPVRIVIGIVVEDPAVGHVHGEGPRYFVGDGGAEAEPTLGGHRVMRLAAARSGWRHPAARPSAVHQIE